VHVVVVTASVVVTVDVASSLPMDVADEIMEVVVVVATVAVVSAVVMSV
jgi:hypothetical protein